MLKFDKSGLIPVVVQDVKTKDVLMVAWANQEAIDITKEKGLATFWSRSRQEIWTKGLTSGNTQKVIEIKKDCDEDTLLYLVEPDGPACHTCNTTCFYRNL
ncbi:MAG: phosphoribosyl-AMP cyclohydrolase [Candidatus Ancillula sp.]|jgi:phosphoribosyl-AMP cyclohydrolase|nr:phosphoribosyl-AMP cyclohydrolase [Candidatus Ancillula sp.]